MTIKRDQYEDKWVVVKKGNEASAVIVEQTELTEKCIQKIAKAVADELERRRKE